MSDYDNLTLYGITEELNSLDEMLEIDEGEVTEDFEHLESKILELLNKKVDSTCGYVQKLNDMIDNAKNQKKRLDIFIQSKERKIERLSQYVKFCIDKTGKNNFSGEMFEIKTRKPAKVLNIESETLVPMEYTEVIKTIKINKNELKKDVKSGRVNIKGISLIDGKQNVSFKLKAESKGSK